MGLFLSSCLKCAAAAQKYNQQFLNFYLYVAILLFVVEWSNSHLFHVSWFKAAYVEI